MNPGTPYNIHPDFKLLGAIRPPLHRRSIVHIQRMMRLLYHLERSDKTVRVERVQIPTDAGNTVRALLYLPKEERTNGAVLYCHGGGYAFPAAPYQYKLARLYARRVGCHVLFPDYRLAQARRFRRRRRTALRHTDGCKRTELRQLRSAATARAARSPWRLR